MRDELQEWYKAADRCTRGDMVYDILKDWKEDRAGLLSTLKRLNACRNRMANAFNRFAAAVTDEDRQEAANTFWAADQDFCLVAQEANFGT